MGVLRPRRPGQGDYSFDDAEEVISIDGLASPRSTTYARLSVTFGSKGEVLSEKYLGKTLFLHTRWGCLAICMIDYFQECHSLGLC
jgi:hypothetical protein